MRSVQSLPIAIPLDEHNLRNEAKKLVTKKYPENSNYRPTHLFMHERNLTEIHAPKSPNNIVHAYYHNNSIKKIQNLDELYNLTHLHFQWNKIKKLEGLDKLYKLRKLYLGNNCISVVENLETLKFLEELHIEKQNTRNIDGLCFDPRTVSALAPTLRILNVSENKIADITWAKPLRRLEVLIAKKNLLEDYEATADAMCTMISLADVNYIGNPMTKKHRYRETIIARCAHLRVLDSVTINHISKSFLQGFDKAVRLRQLSARNKFQPTKDEVDEFFELNMMQGPKVSVTSGISLLGSPLRKGTSPLDLHMYTPRALLPRHFPPPRPPRTASLQPPPEPKQPREEPMLPIKGILKKPMPMKYLN